MFSVSEANTAATVKPDCVLPVRECLHYQARTIPHVGGLVLDPHASAGVQGWKLPGRAVGHQGIAILIHLHLSLAKRSPPVPVYLKVPSGRGHPIPQLSSGSELDRRIVYCSQWSVEVLE